MAQRSCTVAEYLIQRLDQIGAAHLFAVPGDYAGPFLSAVDRDARIQRVGVTNEWVAGYAADAYARLRGVGAVCLTYGVGTFGVLNALAGSYVEELGVALIVGSPAFDQRRVERREGVLYHHSTGTLTADVESVKNVVVAREVVRSGRRAPAQIDSALTALLTWRRPVYVEVYQNAWSDRCRTPRGELAGGDLPLAKRALSRAVDRTLAKLAGAEVPVIWAGVEIQRFGLQDGLEELIRVTGLPWTTDLLGKSVLSEDHPGFQGVFDGASAVANVKDLFDTSTCVLGLGNLVTDDFAVWVQAHYDDMVLAYNNSVRVGGESFTPVPLAAFLERLAGRLTQRRYRAPAKALLALARVPTPGERARARSAAVRRERAGDPVAAAAGKALAAERSGRTGEPLEPAGRATARRSPSPEPGKPTSSASGTRSEPPVPATAEDAASGADRVTYDRFFARLHTWVDDSMVLLADTSIALYSAAELPVRRRDGFIAQAAWNSIGYTPGAAVGVGYAAPDRRAVVLCGDGGFQEIVQAVSDLVRSGHDVVLFVFANALYGIEQAFVDPYYFVPDEHGQRHPPEPFDLLHPWSYAKLTEVFRGGWGVTVETMSELEPVLAEAKARTGLILVELRIPQDSITVQMLQQAGIAG